MKTSDTFRSVSYPRSRVATFDVGRVALKKHHVAGFIEVDVTEMRSMIKRAKMRKMKVSFTSWLLKVIAATIEEFPEIHAINCRGGKQVIFQDIDISLPVEKVVNGTRVPLATLIRAVNRKTIEEIQIEIQEAIDKEVKTEKDFVLAERKNKSATGIFFYLPQWLRLIIWRILLRTPFSIKKNMGTVIVTSTASIARFRGWMLPKTMHNVAFGVGSVFKKPLVIGGQIVARDVLYLSIIFDHDVIDGAPAARFTEKLVKNIEHPFDYGAEN